MGLINNYYQPKFEMTIADCYWKIGEISGSKEMLKVRLNCYKNKTVADTNQNKYADFDLRFVPDLNSPNNFIKQAYAFVKTLPEFSGATDLM